MAYHLFIGIPPPYYSKIFLAYSKIFYKATSLKNSLDIYKDCLEKSSQSLQNAA